MIMQWDALSPSEAERVLGLDPDGFFEWIEAAEGRSSFDVDKAWHAIHFTLAGDAWSTEGDLGAVVLGGEPFGEDMGYGPPRWLDPATVAAMAARLDSIDPAAFAARVDCAAMTAHDIYPSVWDRADERDDNLAWLTQSYATLRDAYAAAASAGQGFVVSLL